MEINRNQVFMIGFVILMIGVQFRLIESFTLNEQTTKALAKMKKSEVASTEWIPQLYMGVTQQQTKTITPPQWIGWAMIAAGAVMMMQSLAMPRPS